MTDRADEIETSQRKSLHKGRGSQIDPQNRFTTRSSEPNPEFVAGEADRSVRTEFLDDNARSVVSSNDSPDLPFKYSLNPYRGCEHGCSYCYARPGHEYYGLSAGLDFEQKIYVKHNAPKLFRDWLTRRSYRPRVIAFSGVTDCYQPCEKQFELTRQCLEVAVEAVQPITIITKNALVLRDIDLLKQLAGNGAGRVSISINSLNDKLARKLEPRTSPPQARLRAIKELTDAGIPVHAMLAPIIPGFNDSEIAAVLQAVAEAGAASATYILLRLPLTVETVFLDWLKIEFPEKMSVVESRIRSTREGRLNSSTFGERMRGTGPIAEQIGQTFTVFARKFELGRKPTDLDVTNFSPPTVSSSQSNLF